MPEIRGRYVVLEGGEGVGKTTQVRRLVDRLSAAGLEAVALREPGGDPFAEAGRALLLGDLPRTPEAEVLLFNAARVQVLLTQVKPALDRGAWVVSDRSRLSTVVYQGHGHGVDLAWVRAVCGLTAQVCTPDLELVLVVDAPVAEARRAHRGTTDRFELLDRAFHDRVDAGYRTEAEQSGLPVVDGTGTPDEVEARLWAHLAPLLTALSA